MDELVTLDFSLSNLYGKEKTAIFEEMILAKLSSESISEGLKGISHLITINPEVQGLDKLATEVY